MGEKMEVIANWQSRTISTQEEGVWAIGGHITLCYLHGQITGNPIGLIGGKGILADESYKGDIVGEFLGEISMYIGAVVSGRVVVPDGIIRSMLSLNQRCGTPRCCSRAHSGAQYPRCSERGRRLRVLDVGASRP